MFYASANFGLSYILELVALVFVAAFIMKYVAPYLKKAMNAKAESIRTQLAQADEARKAGEALVAQRRQALEAARREANEIVEQSRRSATQISEEGERRATAEYERIVGRTQLEISLEVNRVRNEVMSEIGMLVLEASERIIEAELDEPLHRHLIASAITAAEQEASA